MTDADFAIQIQSMILQISGSVRDAFVARVACIQFFDARQPDFEESEMDSCRMLTDVRNLDWRNR
jgi:hypothetical protein